MKTLLGAIFSIGMLSVMAAGFTTDFTIPQGCKNWVRNSWKGYDPIPKFGYDAANKCLHIAKPTVKYGFGLINRAQIFPAKAGDVLVIKYEVKGTGKFFIGVEYHNSKKQFIALGESKHIPLKAQWAKGQLEYKVINAPKAAPTAMVKADLGLTQGSELFIRNISFEVKK